MNPLAIRIAADLKAFKANMAEMRVQLETNAAAMKRMSSSFDGRKVIGDANAMVKSIHDIGGASKLTESEMRRVNSTVTEALAKYKALGREAPPELLALRDATNKNLPPMKNLGDASTSLMGKLKGVAGALGLAFGAAAVVSGIRSLISNTFEYAETIKDTSTKLGISMEATQRYKFAAEQTGASLENVSKSVLKLSQGLAGGDKGLKQALTVAGLEFDKIRAMKPEDAFDAVSEAVMRISDPMLQAKLMLELYGKAGLELLPAMREGFLKLADGVKTMSDDTINRLDDAKDAWQAFGRAVTIYSGEAIGGIMAVSSSFLSGWREAFAIMRVAGEHGMQAAIVMAMAMDKARNSITELSGSSKMYAESASKAGDSAAKIAKALNLSEKNVQAYLDSLKKAPPILADFSSGANKAATEAQRLAEAHQKNVDVLTGKALAAEVAKLAKEVADAGKEGGVSADQYKKLGKELEEMRSRGATLPPILHDIWLSHERLNPSIKVSTDAYKMLADIMKTMPKVPLGMPLPPNNLPISSDPLGILKQIERSLILAGKDTRIKLSAAPAVKTWKDGFVSFMGQAASDIGNSIVRAIEGGGNVVMAAIGTLANSAGQFFGKRFADAVKEDGSKEMSAGMASMLAAGVSVIMGVTSSIISDMLRPIYTALEQVSQKTGLSITEIETRLRGMGAAGVKAFEDMTRAGFSFANMRARITGMDDANSLLGMLDQFQTKEELAKIEAQWKAAYDYMLSSGQYTAAQLAEAWKRYEDAQKAAIGSVDPNDSRPIGARGFPTKAQLQQAVAEAEEAYRYVRDSGLYTAETIEQAWQQWQDAMITGGDKTAKRMKDLSKEILSLQEAIAEELPEYNATGVRIYGVIEQQNIDRLAALEKEKSMLNLAQIAKELHATEVAAAAADLTAKKEFEAAKVRANDLDSYLKKLFTGGYEIPITFRLPGGVPGGGSLPGSSPTFFGGGTLPAPKQGTNSTPLTINVVSQLDGKVVAQNQVKYIPRELDFIGARR